MAKRKKPKSDQAELPLDAASEKPETGKLKPEGAEALAGLPSDF